MKSLFEKKNKDYYYYYYYYYYFFFFFLRLITLGQTVMVLLVRQRPATLLDQTPLMEQGLVGEENEVNPATGPTSGPSGQPAGMIAGIIIAVIVLVAVVIGGVYYYKTRFAKEGAIRLDDSERSQTRRERKSRFQRKAKESIPHADPAGGDLSLLSPARVVEEDINVSAGFDEDADDVDEDEN
jgi:hypothetical protein